MRLETVQKLCCPFDKADLHFRPITMASENRVVEGVLLCTHCDRVYPIVSGIPIMSPDEYRDFSLEQPVLERWVSTLEEAEQRQLTIEQGRIKRKAP